MVTTRKATLMRTFFLLIKLLAGVLSLLTVMPACGLGRQQAPHARTARTQTASPLAVAPDPNFDQFKTFTGIGKQAAILAPGKEVEIFRHGGQGCLTHMWFAMDERVRVKVYVDGETAPSIDMALDLGHGYGFGGVPQPAGSPKMGRYGGQFNTYKIPYGHGVRVTLLPMASFDPAASRNAWWIIRGTEHLPLIIAGLRLPANARLKLYTLEPHDAKPLEEFNLCNVRGHGLLYLVTIAAHGQRKSGSWTDLSYMEGEMRAYINGASKAEELSSGLEDYFLGSGYFNQNQTYFGSVAGLTHLDKANNAFSAYRFHEDDPVFFQSGLRLTLRDGDIASYGSVVGDPPPTTYYTYVWLYQW